LGTTDARVGWVLAHGRYEEMNVVGFLNRLARPHTFEQTFSIRQ